MIVKRGQTIFDVALAAYQDASRAYDLLLDNPGIPNINADLTGLDLEYTASVITTKEAVKTTSVSQINVTIKNTQTIFDIALQYLGSAEKTYDVIANNPTILSLMDNPTNKVLNYVTSQEYVPIYFRKNNLNAATK